MFGDWKDKLSQARDNSSSLDSSLQTASHAPTGNLPRQEKDANIKTTVAISVLHVNRLAWPSFTQM